MKLDPKRVELYLRLRELYYTRRREALEKAQTEWTENMQRHGFTPQEIMEIEKQHVLELIRGLNPIEKDGL